MSEETTQYGTAPVGQLAAALAKAQGKLEGAKKDAKNPHLGNKYADLESCWNACRAVLAANELAVSQPTRVDSNGTVIVTTVLMHSSGESIRGELPAMFGSGEKGRSTMQSLGSAITYARRYGLCAMVGIAPEDDDGAGAGNYQRPQRTAPAKASGISDAQKKRLFAIAKESGHSNADVKQWLLDEGGIASSNDIKPGAQYDSICERLADTTPLIDREPGSDG